MSIDRKAFENEKNYINKLMSYMNRDVEVQLDEVNLKKDNSHIILKNKSILSLLEDDEYTYLTIKDKRISIQSDKKYSVNFTGEMQGSSYIELHMIAYNHADEKLEGTQIAPLNKQIEVKFPDNAAYIKLLVRISGSGVLKNSKVRLYSLGEMVRPKQGTYLASDKESYKDINVEDYKVNTICSIHQVTPDVFYTDCKEIQIDSTIQVDTGERAQYISLYEKNVNFSTLPTLNKIDVTSEHTYYVECKGQVDVGLKVQLFVILYSQNSKEEVYQITLNQSNTILPSSGSKYMRLALRVEGKGSLDLNKIAITSKKRVEFIGYKNLRKLGFDIPKQLSDIKMACIFDEFTTECYKYTCQLMPITPYDWKAQLTIQKPHLLMVESAWVGNGGTWSRKVAYTSENNIKELRELVEWCKTNDIPTVFWNKEDPVHYDLFINTAKMFDYIFTTDENKVNHYKRDAKNEQVYALPFAAQPSIHNPIRISKERNPKACFAGSYYAAKYPERQEDIDRLLDATVETTGIEIYDRYFGTSDKDFLFPERFRQYIKGNLRPTELHIANKGYKVMINVNSVKESPTMFSRRVFEGLACGTPVISSYSEGVNQLFYNIVVASDQKQDLVEELDKLNSDDDYYETKSILGIRQVLKYHTYDKRLEFILDKIGIPIINVEQEISILVQIENIDEFEKALELFDKQSYQNKKLVLMIKDTPIFSTIINENIREDITFINMQYYIENKIVLGEVLASKYISIMDLNNYYAPNYLEDIILAYSYTNADIIGKGSYFNNKGNVVNRDREYSYVNCMQYDRCVVTKDVYKQYSYDRLIQLLDEGNYELLAQGVRLFAIDKYNYINREDAEIISNLIYKKTI